LDQARTTSVSQDIAELSEQLDFDSEVLEILREVFLKLCRTLDVCEPDDPASAAIARTLIGMALASEGECDARELYRRTVKALRTLQ
jgi:hypothetical protein